jgi:hypothetical protein
MVGGVEFDRVLLIGFFRYATFVPTPFAVVAFPTVDHQIDYSVLDDLPSLCDLV